jgi:hypothetical protein
MDHAETDPTVHLDRYLRVVETLVRSNHLPSAAEHPSAAQASAPSSSPPAIVPPPPSFTPGPMRPMMPTINDDGSIGDPRGLSLHASQPSYRPSYPPCASSSSYPTVRAETPSYGAWCLATSSDSRHAPTLDDRPRVNAWAVSTVLLAAAAMGMSLLVAVMGPSSSVGHAGREKVAMAISPTAADGFCADPSSIESLSDTSVVIAPAPTLSPPSAWSHARPVRPAPAAAQLSGASTSDNGATATSNSSSTLASADAPPRNEKLDEAARTAKLLREQLQGRLGR